MYYLYFTDSARIPHRLNYQAHFYPNLMEFIRDQGYEDWGDCRGRAWCATCHLKTTATAHLPRADQEEQSRLDQLSNLLKDSRLACQIPLDKNIHKMLFEFIGAD